LGGTSPYCVVTLVVVAAVSFTPAPADAADPVIAAAGDIACSTAVVNRGDGVHSATPKVGRRRR
jgi:hypothetical protein